MAYPQVLLNCCLIVSLVAPKLKSPHMQLLSAYANIFSGSDYTTTMWTVGMACMRIMSDDAS